MKRMLASSCLAAIVTAGWVQCGHAATLAEIKQRGYMVVAVANEDSAFAAFRRGKRTGFDAALLAELRPFLPFEIRLKPVPAASLAASLESGEADLAATSLEITPERQQALEFLPPGAESTLYFSRRRADAALASLDDLGGRRLGVVTGSAGFFALSEIEHRLAKAGSQPLGRVTEFSTAANAYHGLESGGVDYFIDDLPDQAAIAKRNPKIFAVGGPLAHRSWVGWAVVKGNDDLASLLQGLLLKERRSGGLAALQKKWLGWTFTDLPESVTAKDWLAAREDRPAVLPVSGHHPQD
jgi:polar amino acid transport system substrate-binding protein